jgi:hypothetical protein
VVFAFAPIDDGARSVRERALECVFRWRRFARSGRTRADIGTLERRECVAVAELAPVEQPDDIGRPIRQAEHAALGLG